MSPIIVSELNIFPLKSTRGLSVNSVQLTDRGPAGDRNWMLVNRDGHYLSQRECPRLCLINSSLTAADELSVSVPGMEPITIPVPIDNTQSLVQIWEDRVLALDAGDKAADWFSQVLDIECRVVYMPHETKRPIEPPYAKRGEVVSFSDGFPILLISQASLDEFNSHLSTPILMDRFRPNIVVSGCEAYAEDEWALIKIGGIELRFVKPCMRCVIPSIDPDSGEKQPEVVRALAKHRRRDGKVYFGQNLIHSSQGQIAVNDSVQVVR